MVCLAPVYQESSQYHLAQKVAMYCRMARTCANMKHDEDNFDFNQLDPVIKQAIKKQYTLLTQFLTT